MLEDKQVVLSHVTKFETKSCKVTNKISNILMYFSYTMTHAL